MTPTPQDALIERLRQRMKEATIGGYPVEIELSDAAQIITALSSTPRGTQAGGGAHQHWWNGPKCVIGPNEFSTCSLCGADPTDDQYCPGPKKAPELLSQIRELKAIAERSMRGGFNSRQNYLFAVENETKIIALCEKIEERFK